MSLALTASFAPQTNLSLPLAQSASKPGLAVRVVSAGSGTLGTLTASGQAGTKVSWTLTQNPAWVTLVVDPTTLIATLIFSNAQAQATAYQFFLSATDGTTTVNYPFFLEVRVPLALAATNGATTFSIPSYDNTVADIVFQGVGLNGGIDQGVQFITPAAIPAGMKFITSNGNSMALRVNESSAASVSGGAILFTGSPVSTNIALQAYKQGTFYDNPTRCFTYNVTLESLTATQGVLDVGVTVSYNTSLNAFQLTSYLDFLNGQAQAVVYEWDTTGTATGNITAGGTPTDTSMTWVPATAGNVGFILKVKNAANNLVIGETVINPTLNTTPGIPCLNALDAIKLSFVNSVERGYAGDSPSITISTPADELGPTETVTVNFVVNTASVLEGAATLPVTSVTLTAAEPSASVALTIPPSTFNQKWILTASAANALTGATRTGYAQVVFESNGGQPLAITSSAGTSLTSNVGQAIPPISLTATNGGMSVAGVAFSLCGAPDGLYINSSGQLTGNVLQPGTYTFTFLADKLGYARSYSSPITLVASAFASPLAITDAIPSVASLPDNTQFNVNWGYSGTPLTLNLLQGYTVRSVLGTTTAATSEVGSSVLTVYGSSFYGDAYSIPALVLSSSILALGPLLDAVTIGIIDEFYNLALNWNPLTVDGTYQAYKAWNIWLKALPNGIAALQSINGSLPTGLEPAGATPDSREFATTLSTGDWQVSMQALTSNTAVAANALGWDNPHNFPTAITAASILFDNPTLLLGQTVTISLNADYIGADTWQAIYPDGSTSGWMPISVKSIAKSFTIPGSTPIVIQTQRDYSSANPSVKLRRQVAVTVFVMNQQYTAVGAANDLTGSLGIGGAAGFEITDASNTDAALAPYEVVVRALVRDMVSNELKVMIATSRTADASSLLGTMAVDVFPIRGRPRIKDLVDPTLYLSASMTQPGNPVKIATSTLPNIIVGKPMSDFPLSVVANSGVAPFSWYADGLPFGINLSSNGTLTGTALALGSFPITLVVMDSNIPAFIANTMLTLVVETDLALLTTTLTPASTTVPYTVQVGSKGGLPPYAWEIVSGAPPLGLSINTATGILFGTPATYNSTTDFHKIFGFTIQVTDAIGAMASGALTMTLAPAALQFGAADQSEVFVNQKFELAIPVFGGAAPYNLASFTDDGTIGTGLQVVNPQIIALPAGIEPPTLAITSPPQMFYPQNLPFDPTFQLTAFGGSTPYTFAIVAGSGTAIPSAAIYGTTFTGLISANGTYAASIQCTDSLGNSATANIPVVIKRKNSGIHTIQAVSINTNGSSSISAWTVTPIANLPDAKNGVPYNGGTNIYYGLALYQNNVLLASPNAGGTPMNFSIRSGSLPAGIVPFSGTAYTTGGGGSGIQIFNISGGANATANGSYSFEAEWSNILGLDGNIYTAVARESITVTTAGGGTTGVVVLTMNAQGITVDLATATALPYPWYYPLTAEGGTGPYVFSILSGTTLPGAVITYLNGLPALASATQATGSYVVNLNAWGTAGNVSPTEQVPITIMQSPTQPIHIVASHVPTILYANQPIPANTYYFESDLNANWSSTGLPAGMSLTTTSGATAYLMGTPTATGNFSPVVTATSVSFGTTATTSATFQIVAQSAVFVNPPTTALLGVAYRVVTNNAIISVQYVGYQPGDATLPLVTARHGVLGAPGLSNNGSPTTGVSSLTAAGFTLTYDYSCTVVGTDVLTIGVGGPTLPLLLANPALIATGKTVPATVSEYSANASFAPPVTVSGGLAPYTITLSGFSDPRFSALAGQVTVPVPSLTAGQTTQCSVSMLIVDSGGSSVTATGVLQVTVRIETYEQITYNNVPWAVSIGSAPFTSFVIPSLLGSVPVLGHAPYQFYVDAVAIPVPLIGFVAQSPSSRVLAIQCNAGSTSASISDVSPFLMDTGTFTVAAVAPSAAPPTGLYSIPVTLRVVDNDGLTSTQVVNVNLTIS